MVYLTEYFLQFLLSFDQGDVAGQQWRENKIQEEGKVKTESFYFLHFHTHICGTGENPLKSLLTFSSHLIPALWTLPRGGVYCPQSVLQRSHGSEGLSLVWTLVDCLMWRQLKSVYGGRGVSACQISAVLGVGCGADVTLKLSARTLCS